jgi:POT family proton-dependent oligopeptide transporter
MTDPDRPRHPKGLYVLFATEMWERFSFYTMIAMLTLYLQDKTDGFGWSKADATWLYSNYMMFVYASPLIGGWIADRKLGFRTTITIGGLFFIVGHVLLAFPTAPALYASLTCLVIGNGCFKPNISTMVGNLYPPDSPIRDSAYNIFYMGINIGALMAPLVAEGVRQRYGFHPGFVIAGIGMAVGMVIFWSFQKSIAAADRRPSSPDAEAAAVEFDLPPKPTEMESVPERTRIGALLVIYAIVIVFWMVFHQNGTTMTYWANDNTDWASSKVVTTVIYILTLGFVQGDKISGVVSNSINPFWIVVLSYPLTRVWAWLRSIGREPSTPTKMAIGMLLTCLAFLILYFAAKSGGDQTFVMDSSGRHALDEKGEYAAIQHRVSPYWLVSAFLVISLGELMLSPMGLSLVSKVAPARMRGMMMGGWFVATAIGNKLTAIGLLWTKWYHSSFWLLCSCSALFMAIVLLLLLRPLKKAMPGA